MEAGGAQTCGRIRDRRRRVRADALARLFPRRAVAQVPTMELAKADGGVHCITQQQPRSSQGVL